jgi:predicted RecA/RadA family phage recombinase
MQNYVKTGKTLTLTAPYTVSSGAGALVDGLFGVATSDIASAAEGEFMTEGVYDLASATSQAWTQGQKLYWDNTNKLLTSDGTKGPLVADATEAKDAAAATGRARLLGAASRRAVGVAAESTPAPTSDATAGAKTITAAEVLSGVYVRDCAGASRTDTLPTAALLVAAVPGAKVGDMLKLYVVNGSDAAETLTLAAGSGGAFDTNQTSASRVVPQNASKMVHIRLTNVTASAEAYVVYA